MAVRWCVAKDISPDLISWLSVVAAAIAALCFRFHEQQSWLLMAGAFFCMVRLWFNMLDGMVAIAAGKTSKKGEIVNEFPDRISDVMIFVGIAHSHSSCLLAGYWAAIGALFTAYIGVLSQAASAPRQFGGLMSKPWRMVAVSIAALLLLILPSTNEQVLKQYDIGILGLACWVIAVGCLQTTIQRYRQAMRWLTEQISSNAR